MISQIIYNNYCKKALLTSVRAGRNNEFFIWTFKEITTKKEYVGFTPSKIYFGNKTYLWYSLLVGYFLPPSYNINFNNAINKECYIMIDSKHIVRSIIPITCSSINDRKDEDNQYTTSFNEHKERTHNVPEDNNMLSVEKELFE